MNYYFRVILHSAVLKYIPLNFIIGRSKLIRLRFIINQFDNCKPEACKLALEEIENHSPDVEFYRYLEQLVKELSLNQKNFMNVSFTMGWLEKTQLKRNEQIKNIMNEIKIVQEHYIKESIRIGYFDLGKLYYHYGDLVNALHTFISSREYCSIPIHIIDLCFRIVQVRQ